MNDMLDRFEYFKENGYNPELAVITNGNGDKVGHMLSACSNKNTMFIFYGKDGNFIEGLTLG